MKIDLFQFGVRDFDARGILATVDLGADFQAVVVGGGGADEFHDHFLADEWLAAPVGTDLSEHTVFDLVPLAGAGGEVADRDAQTAFVGERAWDGREDARVCRHF